MHTVARKNGSSKNAARKLYNHKEYTKKMPPNQAQVVIHCNNHLVKPNFTSSHREITKRTPEGHIEGYVSVQSHRLVSTNEKLARS